MEYTQLYNYIFSGCFFQLLWYCVWSGACFVLYLQLTICKVKYNQSVIINYIVIGWPSDDRVPGKADKFLLHLQFREKECDYASFTIDVKYCYYSWMEWMLLVRILSLTLFMGNWFNLLSCCRIYGCIDKHKRGCDVYQICKSSVALWILDSVD